MRRQQAAIRQATQHTRRAANETKPWVERLGRCGYIAIGIVYTLVGLLAMQTALGVGGEITDTHGALEHIVQAPFGRLLLAIVTVGLVGYALWRFVQAAVDADGKGTNANGLLARTGPVVSGVPYTGLALFALGLLRGESGSSSDQTAQDWTARALAQPFGQWLVGLGGAVVIGVGLFQLYRAYNRKFLENLRLAELRDDQKQWVERFGRLGFAGRGVVFGLIGAFLIVAAFTAEPEQARGLGGTLVTLAAQPEGRWLLGLVAIGLVAYGLFMLVAARYRRLLDS